MDFFSNSVIKIQPCIKQSYSAYIHFTYTHNIAYTYIAKVIRYNDKKKNPLKYFKFNQQNRPIGKQKRADTKNQKLQKQGKTSPLQY